MDNSNIKERVWKNAEQEINSKNRNVTRHAIKSLDSLMYLISSLGLPIKLKYDPDFEREDFNDFF